MTIWRKDRTDENALLFTSAATLYSRRTSRQRGLPGCAFDIAPFGFRMADATAPPMAIRWAEPRKVRRVVVEFDEGQTLRIPPRFGFNTGTGSGTARPILWSSSGGPAVSAGMRWTTGRTAGGSRPRAMSSGPNGYEFTFAPTSSDEIPKFGGEGVSYRKTLAVRRALTVTCRAVAFPGVYTDSVMQAAAVRSPVRLAAGSSLPEGRAESAGWRCSTAQVTAVRPISGTRHGQAGSAWTSSSPTRRGSRPIL